MVTVLAQMGGLILCGIGWQLLRPRGLDPADTRKVLTSLVYFLLLPALVLSVLWRAPIGALTLQIALSGVIAVLLGALMSLAVCRACSMDRAASGALVLAAAFPNVTYLGLPVLEATFGDWARSVAIQMDLFACTPLLFTLGVMLAAHFGERPSGSRMHRELLAIPALWAAAVAIALNLLSVPIPEVLAGLLHQLERGVAPLMLIALGLSLRWNRERWRALPAVIPVALITLLLVPAAVYPVTGWFGLEGDWRAAVVLETAMPSMVLGLVLCDRFQLDTGLYAAAVTVTTAMSLISLPLWHQWLTVFP
jgi:predicted permease